MKNKAIILLLLTVAAFVGTPLALANTQFPAVFNGQYNTTGTRIEAACSNSVCHFTAPALNSYGTALNQAGVAANADATTISAGLTAIEPADSDGDGFTNINEIHNLTFPGNAGDFPPMITSSSPTSPVNSVVGGPTTTFTVTVNQPLNVTWLINGTPVQNLMTGADNISTYNNNSATQGTWNVTALAQKPGDGTASQMWTWNVASEVVTPVLNTITVSPPTATVQVGNTQVFTATATDQNGKPLAGISIGWTSDNTTVGTVNPTNSVTDANGNATTTFTAAMPGTAMITAANGTITGNATVTVTEVVVVPELKTIMVSPPTATVQVGNTQVFTATATDQNDKPMAGISISWTSDDASVGTLNPITATTDANGKATTTFTAAIPGTAMITAASGSVMGSANVTVTPRPVSEKGSISGLKINDINGNGKQDSGEDGLSGWTIELRGIGPETHEIERVATTDSNGFYKFDNLPAGKYIVKEKHMNGFIPASPPVIVVSLEKGMDSTDNNFMNRPKSSLMKHGDDNTE